ncbi:hypothetical protein [Nocardiopsis sp. SBT366]|uniref:hypothetical protein n=1 Tax=Nocardiopsis sp. SBT366 TaxID=1580529 RepID=UPI00066B8013|nr:hypothetical protein [Nocardiopsis sp. SBT366]
MNLTNLPFASWDLLSFFENATNYVRMAGGSLLALMGTVGVVWGGVLLVKKLMASQQDQTSWVKIIGLIFIGGALMVGGFSLISTIAAGGRTTIEDLGGGMILFGLDQFR